MNIFYVVVCVPECVDIGICVIPRGLVVSKYTSVICV